jgi:hypothetical protein
MIEYKPAGGVKTRQVVGVKNYASPQASSRGFTEAAHIAFEGKNSASYVQPGLAADRIEESQTKLAKDALFTATRLIRSVHACCTESGLAAFKKGRDKDGGGIVFYGADADLKGIRKTYTPYRSHWNAKKVAEN